MKNPFPSLVILLLTFPFLNMNAQQSGDFIFDNEILHEVRFTFAQTDYWQTLVNNFEFTPDGEKVPYLMGHVTIDGEEVDSVGVRFKGFTSYQFQSDKKPIKIDFNEYVPGRRYDGLRKLNLNNSTGDPGMQRDVICYDLMRKMGVKAPRTSYSRVYFNDVYWGLYQNIEQVDKEFLQNNFTNDKGNLIKNKGWSHFEWLGWNDEEYHPPFELKTNKDNPDWSGFVNLMDILNNSTDANFKKEIEDVFNVDLFLKTLAVDVATNNWDAYIEHGRNWYIYEDTMSSVFHWIPWDYNFSLGGGFFGGPGDDECIIFSDFFAEQYGTTEIKFSNTGFASMTPTYTWDFGDGNTSNEENPVHEYAMHGSYNVCLTTFFDVDCNDHICQNVMTTFNPGDCPSIGNGSCPHPPELAFQRTISWIPPCCDNWNEECEELHGFLSGNDGGGFGSADFTIDQKDNEGVLINRLLQDSDFNERYYTQVCDLMRNYMLEQPLFDLIDHNKDLISASVEEDPNFLFTYEAYLEDIGANGADLGIKSVISERITTLQAELDSIFNCPEDVSFLNSEEVVINEFLASSDAGSGISDMTGHFDDWIELHNTTSTTKNLSGLYLSDDLNSLQKWEIPYGTRISSKGYIIIWCDNDLEDFGLHAPFKLNKLEGNIYLSNEDGSIIDSTSYTEQTTNVASARIPNGTGPFVMKDPTFNFNNEHTSGNEEVVAILSASVFPNPAKDIVNVVHEDKEELFVQMYSADGSLVYVGRKKEKQFTLDISDFTSGFYFIKMESESGKLANKKIIVLP